MRVDRDFLQRFLVEHLQKVRAFVRLRMPAELRRRESESDVVQVACLQVLDRATGVEFRGERALVNWLFGAVDNAVRDMLKGQRAERRNPAREVRDPATSLLESYATFCTPSRILAAKEDVERIEVAMDTLSDAQREVVMLSCLVGLSHDEIAAQTGMSKDSVRTHLHRGLARLAARVDVDGSGRSDA